jgi:hypothetical protein
MGARTASTENTVFLLMPSDAKWSDKATLIQHYLRAMHDIDITLVSEPPSDDGILISLEKGNLISTAQRLSSDSCKLDALVLEDASLYITMDDKAEASWRQLPADGLRFKEIPTLNMLVADEQGVAHFVHANPTFQQLMLKPTDEAASVGQEVVAVHDSAGLLKYLGRPYVAQPFFQQHKILTIDFLAVEGDVRGYHCFYVDGPIENRHWKEGLYQQVVCNAPQHIREEFGDIINLIHSLSTSLCLNGIFEVEFLYDGFHSYFLELNLLPGLYGIDDQGLMPVLEQVVIPYLQHFHVDVQQRIDFHFGPMGQFYPPSGASAPYYKAIYGCVDSMSDGSRGDESTLADIGEDTMSDEPSELESVRGHEVDTRSLSCDNHISLHAFLKSVQGEFDLNDLCRFE